MKKVILVVFDMKCYSNWFSAGIAILIFLFMSHPLSGQVTENFESGKLFKWVESTGGHWRADSINPISGKYSLHHIFDNPEAGIDQIGIPVTNLKPSMGPASWSFKLKHGYDPSSSNNWGIFLIADNTPSFTIPGGNVNGFVIGVNLTGYDDTLRLWKIKCGALLPVLNTGVNWQNDIGVNSFATVIIERSQTGWWKTKVYSKLMDLIDSASGSDEELFNAEWFGIYYKYSSTRDRLLWVDDISIDGVFFEDVEPPEVTLCSAITTSSVDIQLNEEPDGGFYDTENFSLNSSSVNAINIIKFDPRYVRIFFEDQIRNKAENTLLIKSICDKAGNCSKNIIVRFMPVWAETGDVIISEVMADPSPSVSLPAEEYLEIFNRTTHKFSLDHWNLIKDGTAAVFPVSVINPGEFIILCQLQDTSFFSKYGKVYGLRSFPALNDGGGMIVLADSLRHMIHGIEYSSKWYKDKLKENGGWSLEMIDTAFPFRFEGNWTASVSKKGGTPGIANSVNGSNPDLLFKGISNAFPKDSARLEVTFSEPVYNLLENIGGILIGKQFIDSIALEDPLQRKFLIKPGFLFTTHQQYTLSIPGTVNDFAGNPPEVNSYIFGLPEDAINSDVMFNEILFNPKNGDAEFIELYNSSSKTIDASELLLASVNEPGKYSSTVPVSPGPRCIMPGTYFAITTDRESLINRYLSAVPENIFEVNQLPSMPDDKGHLVLFNRQLELIDEIIYNEKMHYSLLSGYEGISLEKVRPQLTSSDPKNWHSASEASGWGTPGTINSIYSIIPQADDRIVFSSKRITPDNDGNEDLLTIDLNLEGGNVVTITVFDETGGVVRKLVENFLAGTETSIVWDGTAHDGTLVRSGIYVFLISVFDDQGKTMKWKKVCAVIR
jgi:hypothetical protein